MNIDTFSGGKFWESFIASERLPGEYCGKPWV